MALASERDLTLMVGHLLCYHPGVRQLADLIEKGDLGDVYYLYSQRLNLGKLRADENALWSLGAHDVSVLLELADGHPSEVTARGEAYVRDGVEDVVFAYIRFDSGLAAHLHLSWLDPHKERRLTVVGSERMATLDDMALERKLTIYDKGFDPAADTYGEYITRSGLSSAPRCPTTSRFASNASTSSTASPTAAPRAPTAAAGLQVVQVLEALQASLDSGGAPQPVGAAVGAWRRGRRPHRHRRSEPPPGLLLGEGVEIPEGVALGGNVVIHAGTTIGEGVTIQDGAIIGKPPKLGARSIASAEPPLPAAIGDGAAVCAGAVVLAGATIGAGAVVGDQAQVRERADDRGRDGDRPRQRGRQRRHGRRPGQGADQLLRHGGHRDRGRRLRRPRGHPHQRQHDGPPRPRPTGRPHPAPRLPDRRRSRDLPGHRDRRGGLRRRGCRGHRGRAGRAVVVGVPAKQIREVGEDDLLERWS